MNLTIRLINPDKVMVNEVKKEVALREKKEAGDM